MDRDDLLRIQTEFADRLLVGEDVVSRMIRSKRAGGIERWMPRTVIRLRTVGWLDRVMRDFLGNAISEAPDPLSDARGFERYLRESGVKLEGLDDAIEEDSARIALLAPDAEKLWGVVVRGGRVFYRAGTEVREVGGRKSAAEFGG
jgi:hypothetical protein